MEELIKGSPVERKAQKKKQEEILFIPGARRIAGTWNVVLLLLFLLILRDEAESSWLRHTTEDAKSDDKGRGCLLYTSDAADE